jgi:hypothetical protein
MSSDRFLDGPFYNNSLVARLECMLHKRERPPALVIATLPLSELADMSLRHYRDIDNTT